MSEMGVAVVGAGFIGPVHVEALKRAGLHVTGILGVNDKESRSAAANLRLPRANETLIRDPALVSPAAGRFINYPGGHNEGFPDTFKQCFRAFYQYIEAGDMTARPTFPIFADGHREIELCEAILESHRHQR